MTFIEFIEKSKGVHGDSYKYLDLSKYTASIECSTHGIFKQNIYKHLKGRGCQKCGKEKVLNSVKNRGIKEEEFLLKLREKYGESFTIKSSYVDYNTKIELDCKKHGKFIKTPKLVLLNGCNSCNKVSNFDDKKLIAKKE